MNKFVITALILYSSVIHADTASDYAAAQSFIQKNQLATKSSQSINNAPVLKEIQKKTPAQQQELNQTKALQNNPDEMASSGSQDKMSQMVTSDMLNTPEVKINPNSPAIKNSQTVQDNAVAISNGTYKDCKKNVFKKTTYVEKTCSRARNFSFSCNQQIVPIFPDTPIVPTPHCRHLVYNESGVVPANGTQFKAVQVSRWFFGSYTVFIYLVSGPDTENECYLDTSYLQMTNNGLISQPIDLLTRHSFTLHNAYSSDVSSRSFSMDSSILSKDKKVMVDLKNTGSRANQPFIEKKAKIDPIKEAGTYVDSLSASSDIGWWSYLDFSYITFPKVEVPQPTFKTIDQCASNPVTHSPDCSEDSIPRCLDNKTRTYNGRSYSNCWDLQTNYHCGGAGPDTCSPLESEGCSFLKTSCSQVAGGMCINEKVTYQCPEQIEAGTGLVCGSNVYCLDGSCQTTPKKDNQDFGKSATELSAVNSAAGDVAKQNPDPSINQQNIHIFTGKQAFCRDMTLGIMNCCRSTGWLKDILFHCNDQEVELGKAREKGNLVVQVGGTFCSHHFIWCTEHKQGFCIFPSHMAYDVQTGGRKQLGMGFGSAQNPNCSGFTPQQLQKVNFDNIDFSNIVAQTEHNKNIPNDSSEQSRIEQQIQSKMAGG